MNFDLTEEQLMLQDTVGQAMQNECPITHLRTIFDGDSGHDPALWKTLAELGVVGLAIPEEYGGAGLRVLNAHLEEPLGAPERIGSQQDPADIGHTLGGCFAFQYFARG